MEEVNSDLDELQLYFGDDYVINDHIRIHQPTIGEIVEMGERSYFSMVTCFTAIPSDMIAQLHQMGIDWMEISDFELFAMMARSVPLEHTKLLFGDSLDFSKFDLYLNQQNNMLVMQNPEGVCIDVNIYNKIVNYLRTVHGIVAKPRKAYNKMTKKIMIQEAEDNLRYNRKKPYKSMLRTLISSMVNSPGYKYNIQETRDLNIFAFMDAVQRVQVITSAQNLTLGAYMGNIDMKKIDKKQFDWMRELEEKK